MDQQTFVKIKDWSTASVISTEFSVRATFAPHVHRQICFKVEVDKYPEDHVNAFKTLRNFCYHVYESNILTVTKDQTNQQRALDLAYYLGSCGCNVITVWVKSNIEHDATQVTVTRAPTFKSPS